MTTPSFSLLSMLYPVDRHPCSDRYENQCAIRLSIALVAAGFDLSGYPENKCSHGHARGAEPLANFLRRRLGRPVKTQGSTAFLGAVRGKAGIVFFKDITGFRGGRGDHIDLWEKTRTKTGEYSSESTETWFWELK